MRSLLPLRILMKEICEFLNIERDQKSFVSNVWEDNQVALKLATSQFQNMTPRTKHIGCKYHFFKSHVKGPHNESGEIDVKWVHTSENRSDIFTKGLTKAEFERKRKMLVGW